ncbi:MAG: monofunctional biosynthetic peptidoglycan transglycosylase [Desulfatiglandaceae bacterium]
MAVGLAIVVSSAQVFSARLINMPFTMTMLIEWMEGAPFPWPGLRATWRPLDHICPELRLAVLAAEDQRFLNHRGFDMMEIKAVIKEAASGGDIRGASTITMQTARTLFLTTDRKLWRKAAEAWYTLLMELMWSKARILETYLNTVDWGSAGRGAERASRYYFNTSAERLTSEQAALLAAVLPSPHRWSPISPDEFLIERQRRILRQMYTMPLVQ